MRAIDEWGRLLGGAPAIDDAGPVAEWVTRNWPWLSPPDFLRLGVFLASSRLHADQAAQAAVEELAARGYGVVPTPAGIYVYGSALELLLRPATLLPVVDKVLAHTDAMVAERPRRPGA
ncbi:MAG: hypothetical protein IT373_22630 [Polyangiaceae bacterium]|nr:hypothetical protein [Polyangiaceae bacterium]